MDKNLAELSATCKIFYLISSNFCNKKVTSTIKLSSAKKERWYDIVTKNTHLRAGQICV